MAPGRIFLLGAVALVAVAAPTAANAGYDARLPELQAVLKTKQVDEAKERQMLEQFASAVIANRNDCLNRLVEILADQSEGKPQAEAWKTRVAQARESLRSIGASTSSSLGNEPTIGAMNFHQITMMEEDRFLEALQTSNVPELRDQLMAAAERLTQAQKDLDQRWASLSSDDDALDDKQKALIGEMNALVTQAISDAARLNKTLMEKAATLALWKETTSVAPDADDVIQETAKVYVNLNTDLQRRMLNYMALSGTEEMAIYPLFVRFRSEAAAFLAEGKFDEANIKYGAAKASLDTLVSQLPTAGQKSDAEALRAELLSKLDTRMSVTQTIYNAFLDRHRGKFFGPISDATLVSLAEGPFWKNEWDKINQQDLGAKVKEWRRMAENMWDADTSSLSAADRKLMQDALKTRIDELVNQLPALERLGKDFIYTEELAIKKDEKLK